MDLIKLKTFLTVARLGSFTRAAEALFLTQPAVSLQIKDLENEYRTPLLERVGRTVRLTPAGQELMPYVEAILESAKQSHEALEGMRNSTAGRVRIGATGLSGVHMLPELIAEFMDHCPECHIDVVLNYALQLRRMILTNDLDLGIMGSDQGGLREPSLLEQPLVRDEVVVVVDAAHRLAARKSVDPGELAEEKIIMPPRTALTRKIVDLSLRKKGLVLNVEFEISRATLIKRMVEQKLGISLLCRSEIRREVEAGWLRGIPLAGVRIPRNVIVVYHRDKPLSPALSSFIEFLSQRRRHFQKLFVGKA